MEQETLLIDKNNYQSSDPEMHFKKLVESQHDYFRSGEPAKLENRKAQLLKLRKAIIDDKDLLTEAVQKDLRRRPQLTYMYEIATVVVEIDYMLDNLEAWSATTTVSRTLLTMLDTPKIVREPKGVVLILGPWNYPINSLLTPLVAVLAAGNTAILKPSEISSHTAQALEVVLSKAFEKNSVSVVLGGVEETTELLQERFDHIIFTGSTVVGKIIMSAAAKHLTPCTLELGGKCPVIVEPDADIQITARRLAWGKWLNCGQTCLAPDYILCTEQTKQALVEEMTRVLTKFYKNDAKNSPDYSRIINEHHFDRLSTILSKTTARKIYEGGESNRADLFIPPIILDTPLNDPVMHEEVFGPLLPIITVDSFDSAIKIVSQSERPLAAYLFTRDERKVKRFLTETSSGSVVINDVIIQLTVDTLPFGGIGNSGMGRIRGKFGFDEFTHEKAVLQRGFFGDGIAAARYPPLTDAKIGRLQLLTGKRRAIPKLAFKFLSMMPLLVAGFIVGYLYSKYF